MHRLIYSLINLNKLFTILKKRYILIFTKVKTLNVIRLNYKNLSAKIILIGTINIIRTKFFIVQQEIE